MQAENFKLEAASGNCKLKKIENKVETNSKRMSCFVQFKKVNQLSLPLFIIIITKVPEKWKSVKNGNFEKAKTVTFFVEQKRLGKKSCRR